MSWLDGYIAGTGENMDMDDLSAMRLRVTGLTVSMANRTHPLPPRQTAFMFLFAMELQVCRQIATDLHLDQWLHGP